MQLENGIGEMSACRIRVEGGDEERERVRAVGFGE